MTTIRPSDTPAPGRRRPVLAARIRQLFRRYTTRHLTLDAPGLDLKAATSGAIAGKVARIALSEGRLVITGATTADRITALMGRERYEATLEGQLSEREFTFDLPFAPGPIRLEFTLENRVYPVQLEGISPLRLALSRHALWPGFLRATLRALPAWRRWKQSGDFAAREEVKVVLGLTAPQAAQQLDPGLLAPASSQPLPDDARLTIVMPIYDAFDLVIEALDRLQRHTDLPWRLIMIDDASRDARVRPWLRDWVAQAGTGRAELIEHDENKGFVVSANAGLARARTLGDPVVVLLNSDAFVPAGWASRLARPILEDERIASVTPMSNDAEIFSTPVIARAQALEPGEADRIDAVARRFNSSSATARVPTGVGFCMAINSHYLGLFPSFDTAFGRGYGEETDWCQKVRGAGGQHVGLVGLFVEHRGAGSFGSAEKRQRMAESAAEIARRYPGYDDEVQDFLRRDPLTTGRLALAIAWAAGRQQQLQTEPTPIYLAHSMGGGAEKYLERRLEDDLAKGGAAIVIRVGQAPRFRLELHTSDGVTQGLTGDIGLVRDLLAPLRARRVIYSCGVGDSDPVTLPHLLCTLADGENDRLEVLLHDYYALSPSYTLLDAEGRYFGLPDDACTDAAHLARRPDGSLVSLAEWRAAWGELMERADEVTVFSEASKALVAQAYPQAIAALTLRPHLPLAEIPKVARPAMGARPVIGVLGNVGFHKGAGVLAGLSRLLARDPRAGLVVIGEVDPGYPLVRPAVVHGAYRHADIPALASRYGITDWLIPSIWPETFSFATREAIATGLPVWSFDLGAQAEAVRAHLAAGGAGGLVALEDGQADPARVLATILAGREAEQAR